MMTEFGLKFYSSRECVKNHFIVKNITLPTSLDRTGPVQVYFPSIYEDFFMIH